MTLACIGSTVSQNVPLPYHEVLNTTVLQATYVDDRLLSIELTVLPIDSGQSSIVIDKSAHEKFNRFDPLNTGDQSKIRRSIIIPQNQEAFSSYDVLEKIDNKLTHTGYGIFKLKKNIEQYKKFTQKVGGSSEDCYFLSLKDSSDPSLMIDKNILVRIDFSNVQDVIEGTIFEPLNKNSTNYKKWKEEHPTVEIWPHEYQTGDYLIWYSKDKKSAIVADYIEGKIKLIKVGLVSHATLVEGCS